MKRAAIFAVLAIALQGCGVDLFGKPKRVETDGFRAVMTVRDASAPAPIAFRIASRGENIRREPLAGTAGPIVLVLGPGQTRRALELDPVARTYREIDAAAALQPLREHPLGPRFSEIREAARRGIHEYSRESDSVFAGNACQLWRFADNPAEPRSSTTTYWSASALDGLVVRVDRTAPQPDGTERRLTTELTSVLANASPSLFEIPAGFQAAPR